MPFFEQLNSPLQHLDTLDGVEVWLKRDDQIHPEVSGNKWRKLKYYLEDFKKSGKKALLTFGGAFSNHLAATAALANMAGISAKALVRGEEVQTNPTLDFCRQQGMEIEAISRKRYHTKDDPEFLQMMAETLPQVYLIPEGGKGPLGVKGCTEVLAGVDKGFHFICAAAGTGTTMTGLLLSDYPAQFLCFPALKGGHFLKGAIARQLIDYCQHFSTGVDEKKLLEERLSIIENYHFGGYAKVKPSLITFMNEFYRKYQVPLDPVYTGKMMFGLYEMIEQGYFKAGTRLLVVHTGGLQGIKGMNRRLKKLKQETIQYEG